MAKDSWDQDKTDPTKVHWLWLYDYEIEKAQKQWQKYISELLPWQTIVVTSRWRRTSDCHLYLHARVCLLKNNPCILVAHKTLIFIIMSSWPPETEVSEIKKSMFWNIAKWTTNPRVLLSPKKLLLSRITRLKFNSNTLDNVLPPAIIGSYKQYPKTKDWYNR